MVKHTVERKKQSVFIPTQCAAFFIIIIFLFFLRICFGSVANTEYFLRRIIFTASVNFGFVCNFVLFVFLLQL